VLIDSQNPKTRTEAAPRNRFASIDPKDQESWRDQESRRDEEGQTPSAVVRLLESLLDKALAARGAAGLTSADDRALNWSAENVGERGFFDHLSVGPVADS
jgi:hypothetical protein